MRRKGWFRLWIVLTVICVPIGAYALAQPTFDQWKRLDDGWSQICLDQEDKLPNHPDALACMHSAGADRTMFAQEHTTPLAFWGEALGIAFVIDLVFTGLVIGAFFVGRWVLRGFKPGVGHTGN